MESLFNSKLIASKNTPESLHKYEVKISTLPKENGWSSMMTLRSYQHFWFHSFFLKGAMHAQDHFQAQPGDIFLCNFMKTGCTWLKALSFSIITRTHFDDSNTPIRNALPHDCIPMLEFGEYYSPTGPKIPLYGSHIPYTCLPKSIIHSRCKIVYLCRDPKDTFVSMWHYFKRMVETNKTGKEVSFVSIEEAIDLFCRGVSSFGPYWDHVLGYWKASLEHPERILFLRYEAMKEETESCVKKLAEFFGCPFSLEEERGGKIEEIIELCSFESLSNLEVNKSGKQVKKDGYMENSAYFRKGKVGDWRNYLSDEMGNRLDNIMEDKLTGSGFSFLNK
ncbi:multiple C2 and transmembrane domain-containing protein 2-like isoform 1 [Hibiscus syriacus]|uniref:Sulfotransferase n=1 Tax=Hibiscus syriacus TaxID=106335 RepID=A0A6A3BP28_HIBSY|nr:flavonol 3-sulfotransferase-like [Hibiscus syriacus]KAE8718373.1 multiple C2 and transmembrane domain-containing protein 2-like isoform 1 [Hibiscus syriacus]